MHMVQRHVAVWRLSGDTDTWAGDVDMMWLRVSAFAFLCAVAFVYLAWVWGTVGSALWGAL